MCTKFSSLWKIIFIFSCIFSWLLWNNFFRMTLYQQRYFFDHKTHKCRAFIYDYGGCYENENNLWQETNAGKRVKIWRMPWSNADCRYLRVPAEHWSKITTTIGRSRSASSSNTAAAAETRIDSDGSRLFEDLLAQERNAERRSTTKASQTVHVSPGQRPLLRTTGKMVFRPENGTMHYFLLRRLSRQQESVFDKERVERIWRVMTTAMKERGDSCAMPKESGPCKEAHFNWFWDATKSRCNWFYYSGCGGNQNWFDSESECMERCQTNACPPFSCNLECNNGYKTDARGCRQN